MFEVSRLFQHYLLLMLRNTLELAKDIISKNSIIFKIFSEQVFELFLYYQILSIRTTFLLMPLLDHFSIKKQDGKKNLI